MEKKRRMRQAEASIYTGVSESLLAKLRMEGRRHEGPRFSKLGKMVVYDSEDLDTWINQNRVEVESNE